MNSMTSKDFDELLNQIEHGYEMYINLGSDQNNNPYSTLVNGY